MAKGANMAKMAIVAKMAKVATMDEMARVQCLSSHHRHSYWYFTLSTIRVIRHVGL